MRFIKILDLNTASMAWLVGWLPPAPAATRAPRAPYAVAVIGDDAVRAEGPCRTGRANEEEARPPLAARSS